MRFRNGFRIQCILTGHTSLTFSYGVTFLAFGNGAPDIFSAVAAITNAKDGDAGLAIGALFGKTLHWVRSIMFPGSTPVRPWSVQIALTSFQGLTQVNPKCPACGTSHLGQ